MITQEQKDLLLEAIEVAEEPAACTYVRQDADNNHGPICVIGQLYALLGGDPSDMYDWGGMGITGLRDLWVHESVDDEFSAFPRKLLHQIQRLWDSSLPRSTVGRREAMVALVEAAAA